MYFLSHTLHVCYFSILIRLINGYFLFAANLDDFHSLAKKLAPDTLADGLRSLAYRPFVRQKDESTDFDENSDESEGANESLPPIKGAKAQHVPIKGTKGKHKSKEIFELNHGKKVDFEELVERVKKRLASELKRTYLDRIREEDATSLNIKTRHDNKVKKSDKSDKNVAKSKKQDKKKQKERFSTEEISPFVNEPGYVEDTYNKPKENNGKILTDNKYNINVASPKKQVKQFNIEEMSPFADIPDYKEDIFNKPKMNSDAKTKINDYENALKFALKDANVNSKKINKHPKLQIKLTTSKSYDLYKKLDMTKKDSYEDYVTPAKENKVFISTESKEKYTVENRNQKHDVSNKKRYRIKSNRQSYYDFNDRNRKTRHENTPKTPFKDNLKALNNEYLKNEDSKTDTEKPIGSDEMKAKTENLWYKNDKKVMKPEKPVESDEMKAKTENLWYKNDKKIIEPEKPIGSDEMEAKTGKLWYKNDQKVYPELPTKKSNLNTKLPRRHTYKMATPNYLSHLPVVVEKYNFDEPLPERDREREDLKYIGNPPASVNKKVLL